MDNTILVQQMIDMNRSVLENVWGTVTLLQDQLERTSRTVLDQRNTLVEEGNRFVEEWTKEYKKGRTVVKKALDENFEQFLGLFAWPDIEKPKKTKQNG